jgi:hypothetical protein
LAVALGEDTSQRVHHGHDLRFRKVQAHPTRCSVRLSHSLRCPLAHGYRLGYYSSVCPSYKQRTYTFKTDATPNGEIDLAVEGKARLHQLQVLLAGSDDGCIRIQGEVFDDTYAERSDSQRDCL